MEYFNGGDYSKAIGTLKQTALKARENGNPHVAAEAMQTLLGAYVRLFDFFVASQNWSNAKTILELVRQEAEAGGERESEALLLATMILRLSDPSDNRRHRISPEEWSSLQALLAQHGMAEESSAGVLTLEDREQFCRVLRAALFGRKQPESAGTAEDALSDQVVSEQYTRELWELGLSQRHGWRHASVQTLSPQTMLHRRQGAELRSNDPEVAPWWRSWLRTTNWRSGKTRT